jgi:nitrate reductase delta subunit
MPTPSAFALGPRRKSGAGQRAALARIKDWTRARFGLGEDVVVSVAELDCTTPGCPPVDTVVAFWTAPDRRHHFRIFKPAAEVVADDLPPAWMKDRLVVDEVLGCPCC